MTCTVWENEKEAGGGGGESQGLYVIGAIVKITWNK